MNPVLNVDAYEVHPCAVVGYDRDNNLEIVEQVDRNARFIHFWTVYAHCPGIGLHSISDHRTERLALRQLERLQRKLKYRTVTLYAGNASRNLQPAT